MSNLKKSKVDDMGFSKAVDEVEAENEKELNDVAVSEDGYVHDEPLLAGYIDKDGILHSTFSYREMNGKDEEAINKSDVRSNPARVSNILIERCVSEIGTLTKKELGTKVWSEVVRNLLGGDIDYITLKIREISKGKELIFKHTCPECKAKLTTIASTDELGVLPFNGLWEVPFELPRGYKDTKGVIHKDGVMRVINGFDREVVVPLFRKNKATATTLLITRLIKFNDGAVVLNDLVSNMSLRDREYLEKLMEENSFGLDTHMDIVCTTCGTDLSGEVGTSNFF